MGQPFVPPIQRHLNRPTTKASAKRSYSRLVTNINSQVGDVVNPTGVPTGVETPGGGGGATGAAHALKLNVAAQTIPATTTTALAFSASPVFDTDSWFNSGTNIVTVTVKGIYELKSFVEWGATSGDEYDLTFEVNNIPVFGTNELTSNVSASFPMQNSTTVQLDVGDTVGVTVESYTGIRNIGGGVFDCTLIGTVP